jgi:hypothetical protein
MWGKIKDGEQINSSWEIGADISLYNGVSFCFFYLTNTNGRSILSA